MAFAFFRTVEASPPEKGDKNPHHARENPSRAPPAVSFLRLSQKAKREKNEKQPRKHRQSERQATRVPISLGSGRHGTISTKHSPKPASHRYPSRRRLQPARRPTPIQKLYCPSVTALTETAAGRLTSTGGCQPETHILYTLSPPSRLVVIRRRPAAAAASRLKPTFCFRRRRRARGGGSECDEYPPAPLEAVGRRPSETKLGFTRAILIRI